MAITNEQAIKNILKVFYRDGVENLLIRDSSALKEISMTKVEGKAQNFAALFSRGGAVASDYTVAQAAAKQVDNAEFSVEPGKLFAVYTYNAGEVQASLSKKGAYMKVAGNKMMAATTAFRQTLAASLYGRGYGEIGVWVAGASVTASTPVTFALTEDAVAKIDIGSKLAIKADVSTATVLTTVEVTGIDGVNVTGTPDKTAVVPANAIVAIAGSVDTNGPRMPMGLDGWLPVIKGRDASDSDWTNYIKTTFYGVNRASAPDRLAGQFYKPSASEKISVSVQKLLRKCRRAGSNADLIIMNDEDFLAMAQEIESTNTYFTQTSTKAKKNASVGFEGFSASFSTNFIENIIDDPYCPKGKFYILDKAAVEYFVYTNADKALNDGVAGNNPGKQDAEALDNAGQEKTGYNILIDDLLTVRDGGVTSEGPAVEVALNFFGSLAVTNPSVCGVGFVYNANGYDSVLGYLA